MEVLVSCSGAFSDQAMYYIYHCIHAFSLTEERQFFPYQLPSKQLVSARVRAPRDFGKQFLKWIMVTQQLQIPQSWLIPFKEPWTRLCSILTGRCFSNMRFFPIWAGIVSLGTMSPTLALLCSFMEHHLSILALTEIIAWRKLFSI